MTMERRLAHLMMGQERPSVMMTSAYKLTMAQAGCPLRRERFYLCMRKPGSWHVPFDMAAVIQALLPDANVTVQEDQFLRRFDSNGYDLSPAMLKALAMPVEVHVAPKGSWVVGNEPILSLEGPSFKASWPEDMAIWLHFPIQVATDALRGERLFNATCEDEARIIELTLEAVGVKDAQVVRGDPDAYAAGVEARARNLVAAAGGATTFEVGQRAATCMQRHEIALRACQRAGITMTSNLFLAEKLGMRPIGTAGHEHQSRHGAGGGTDHHGYRALRDMRPKSPSYLPDTTDADRLGLPAALDVILETPERECFVRFDERDKIVPQLRWLCPQVKDLPVDVVFEDGIDPPKTEEIGAVCDDLGIEVRRRHFGSGGFLVVSPGEAYGRNQVEAVYKLCLTGIHPVMKFSSPLKQSRPGNPVILRRLKGPYARATAFGLIAQKGETVDGYAPLDPNDPEQMTPVDAKAWGIPLVSESSVGTAVLEVACRKAAGLVEYASTALAA